MENPKDPVQRWMELGGHCAGRNQDKWARLCEALLQRGETLPSPTMDSARSIFIAWANEHPWDYSTPANVPRAEAVEWAAALFVAATKIVAGGGRMSTFARLPRMTDPLGRHWDQPKGLRDRVRIFETHATIDEADWQKLPRYESSYPTGAYAGKAWRRGHWLCWYGRPHMVIEYGKKVEVCSIGRARVLVQGPGVNITGPKP